MVIETQIHAAAVRAHISGAAMIHGDVMDELAAEIEIREKIILTLKIEPCDAQYFRTRPACARFQK